MRWHRQYRPSANQTGPKPCHRFTDICQGEHFEIELKAAVLQHRAEFRIAPVRSCGSADGIHRQHGNIREKPPREIHGR